MDREKSSLFFGLGLLLFGIVVLMLVLSSVISIASAPGPFLQAQLGGSQDRAPTAIFGWTANGLAVNFTDGSSSGSAPIAAREWDFGDGSTGTGELLAHTYSANGTYAVRLVVRDDNGLEASALAQVNVAAGSQNGGASEFAPNFDLNVGDILLPVAVAILTFGMWVVGFLVGGSLVKAGWNLIRPRPETIRIRLRPQQYESGATAEVVPPASAAPPPSAPPAMPPPPDL